MYSIAYNYYSNVGFFISVAQKPLYYVLLHLWLSIPPLPTLSRTLCVNPIFSLLKGNDICLKHDFEIAIIFSD